MFKRFAAGFATGYVFGARAGQKRYEQLTELAERALDVPWVQRLAEGGQTMATEQGRRVLGNLRERARWIDEGGEDEDEQDGEEQAEYDDEQGAYDDEEAGVHGR